jgi:acyl carrier protein
MAESLEEEVFQTIQQIFRQSLERESPVELRHDLLRELHVDSLSAIVLAVELENRFRVKLTEFDTAGVVTVNDLVGRVAMRVREAN